MLSSLGKRILILFGALSLLFVGVGSSAYLVQKIQEGVETSLPGPIDPNDTVTVSVRYQIGTEQRITHDEEREYIAGDANSYQSVTNEAQWNTFVSRLENFKDTENGTAPALSAGNGFSTDQTFNGWLKNDDGTWAEYKVFLEVDGEIKREESGTCSGSSTSYSGGYRLSYQPADEVVREYDYRGFAVQNEFDIARNAPLDREYFLEKCDLTEENYVFFGFLLADASGQPTDIVFEEGAPVTGNLDIYANFEYIAEADSGTLLAQKIASLGSGDEALFNANLSNVAYCLEDDPSWFVPTSTVFWGGPGQNPVVNANTKVIFGLNNGEAYMTAQAGSKNDYEPDDLQYRVVLQSDVVVRGTLFIGSSYGGNGNTGSQGFIQNEYVSLDLNGYDLIVESGGLVDCRGIVEDSRGGGNLILRGGSFSTLIVIMDSRGGTMTLGYKDYGAFPYEAYMFPYIRARIVLERTEEFGWGQILAQTHIKPTSLGMYVQESLRFIGADKSLFNLIAGDPAKGASRVVLEGARVDGSFTTSEKNACLDRRVVISFENVFCRMDEFSFKVSFEEVNTSELDFPLSPFFDILAYDSTIVFNQSVKFLPGSSFVADERSVVVLSYDSAVGRAARVSVLDKGYKYFDSALGEIEKADTTITTSGTAKIGYASVLWNSDSFWKIFSEPRVIILGTIAFQQGNKAVAPYTLVGPIDFSGIAVSGDSSFTEIEPVSALGTESPFAKAMGQYDLDIRTSSFDILIENRSNFYHKRGYARPLVSYGTAYHETGNPDESLVGTYSFRTGVFESGGKTYFFDPGDTYQDNTHRSVILREATYGDDHVFRYKTDAGEELSYIYFASAYYPYDSVSGKVTYGRIDGGKDEKNNPRDNTVAVSWNEEASRWRRT